MSSRCIVALAALALGGLVIAPAGAQDTAHISITYTGKAFEPAEIAAAADKPFTLRVKNAGAKAMEFEGKTMKVEKVIAAGSEAIVNVRPLKAGSYEFFDEFNERARGKVVVK